MLYRKFNIWIEAQVETFKEPSKPGSIDSFSLSNINEPHQSDCRFWGTNLFYLKEIFLRSTHLYSNVKNQVASLLVPVAPLRMSDVVA